VTATGANRDNDNEGWIAIYTKPNQEELAVRNIARQGYEAYCPTIRRKRTHARKVEVVRRPLFPSYVFARLLAEKPQWRPLVSTKGVRNVVRFENRLGFLPAGLVEQLKRFEADDMLEQVAAPSFEPGAKVKVIEGPFRSFVAKVLSVDERGRIWLLLDCMGQAVRAQFDAWSLEH
jgi:transcriptional antiterminator RfaH